MLRSEPSVVVLSDHQPPMGRNSSNNRSGVYSSSTQRTSPDYVEEMSDVVPSLLLRHYIRQIRENHKHVKLCKAQCRLISRRLGVIHDILARTPHTKPSPGLLSAFQDACFILTKMTVSEEDEQVAKAYCQQSHVNNTISSAVAISSDGTSLTRATSGVHATADTNAMANSSTSPPNWLFMLRQRYICAMIFNNFRQRLRNVWSLQPTGEWEAEDLKAQKEDEETALRTLIEHAHVFDGTPMALPLLSKKASSPPPESKDGSGAFAAGDYGSALHLREVDIDQLRRIMRRAGTSSAWKVSPTDIVLPPNGYYSYEFELALQRYKVEHGRAAANAVLSSTYDTPSRPQHTEQPLALDDTTMEVASPIVTVAANDKNKAVRNDAERQQRFRVYLNGVFQTIPFVVLKELDPSVIIAGADNSLSSPQQQPPFVHPLTMESFVIDVTTRRGWCHPNLIDVLGGYAERLTESVDPTTGRLVLGATPALGAIIEQLPTMATIEKRRDLFLTMHAAPPTQSGAQSLQGSALHSPTTGPNFIKDGCSHFDGPSPSQQLKNNKASSLSSLDRPVTTNAISMGSVAPVASVDDPAPLAAQVSSIPQGWQSSHRLYTTLHEMLFVQYVPLTLVEIIDIIRQVADALQYISFDAENVTEEILRTWFAITPSNIYLREIRADANETQIRDRLKKSKFEVRILPRFHVADGPVNRWDPPFDAESPSSYALAQLMIGMITKQAPFRTAESQIELMALLSAPAAVIKLRQQHQRSAPAAVAAVGPSAGGLAGSVDLNSLYENNKPVTVAVPSAYSGMSASASSSGLVGHYHNAANNSASVSMTQYPSTASGALVGGGPSSPSPAAGGASLGALPKGVEVPIGLPPVLQDLLHRCLLRRSDNVPDHTQIPRTTSDALRRGKVPIGELRQTLNDLFFAAADLVFEVAAPTSESYSIAMGLMGYEGVGGGDAINNARLFRERMGTVSHTLEYGTEAPQFDQHTA